MKDTNFDDIIPTAIKPAIERAQAGIPHAQDFLKALSGIINLSAGNMGMEITPELITKYKKYHAAQTEQLDTIIGDNPSPQILEIASGFDVKGLEYCKKNAKATYVELDLEKLMKIKNQVFAKMGGIPNNLHLVEGDATKVEEFAQVEKFFDPKNPVIVTMRGLLTYMTEEQIEKITSNIAGLLGKFGGSISTYDFRPEADYDPVAVKKKREFANRGNIKGFKNVEEINKLLARYNLKKTGDSKIELM